MKWLWDHKQGFSICVDNIPVDRVNSRAIACVKCGLQYVHPLLAYYCCCPKHRGSSDEYCPLDPGNTLSLQTGPSKRLTPQVGKEEVEVSDDDDWVENQRFAHAMIVALSLHDALPI